jgi:hypothetical protein
MSDMRQHVTDQVHREETAAQLALQGAAARQQLRQATLLVAALVARMGGDVEVTDMDLAAIEALTLVTQRTADGLRLAVVQPDPSPGGGPSYPPGDEGVTMTGAAAGALIRTACEAVGDEAPGLAEVVIHEPECPNAPGGAGCANCACDVAGLAPVDVPGYPGAVTLDGDMITRPWRYR